MIFYFSGTGNSQWVAQSLAQKLQDQAQSIVDAQTTYQLAPNENLGFVFPIYAWDAPQLVHDFIKNLKLENYQQNYVYLVATCHTQCGNADGLLKKTLLSKQIILNAGFSVNMPNNYLLAPFIKTDSPKKRQKLLQNAVSRIEEIAQYIRQKDTLFDLSRGWKGLSLIAPFFRHFMTDKKFWVEQNKCIKCGICKKICPLGNINLSPYPKWNGNCTMCQACLHHCPQKAIQYGLFTKGKARYLFTEDNTPHD